MIVAIDGPAGAGKSTVARAVAERLGFRHLDTGALYRAVAVAAHRRGIDPSSVGELVDLARSTAIESSGERLSVGAEDVTDALRDPGASAAVSIVASHPEVRAVLIPTQRQAAARGDVVVEGRDMGTTVFPEADVKIFLTANDRERARRRARQLGEVADPDEIERIRKSIEERDRLDSTRSASPLMKADDAMLLDTSDLTFDEVVDRVVDVVRDRGAR